MSSQRLTAADLAALTRFRGIPAEFAGPLAQVLARRQLARLGATQGLLQPTPEWGAGLRSVIKEQIFVTAGAHPGKPGHRHE